MTSKQKLTYLVQKANSLGATSSAIISSKEIQIKDYLAALCNGEYICPNYGLAASCPPYVEGPAEFRKWQAQSEYSITIQIELPRSAMFSNERKRMMRLLHHIVATVEQKAIESGFKKAKGFAGGSCKELFCNDQEKCCVIAENKTCLYRSSTRPSMSGFGIDVALLMKSSGWPAQIATNTNLSDKNDLGWIAGLIMLA